MFKKYQYKLYFFFNKIFLDFLINYNPLMKGYYIYIIKAKLCNKFVSCKMYKTFLFLNTS